MLTICYKTKEPVVYNKGTKYEKSNDTFLLHYYSTEGTKEEQRAKAIAKAEKYNREHTTGDRLMDRTIEWDNIEKFFVSEQEMFDTTGN